ncbi:MAG: hypothetical protein JXL80_10800 [Planctomycetes bacterium]|nr:hypothetical protein [Planctomycetota bacterium]
MAASRPRSIIALTIALGVVGLGAWSLGALTVDAQSPMTGVSTGAAGRFTMTTAPLGDKKQGVFIIDAETMRLLVYAVNSDTRQLKLVAVRDLSQDVRLSHFNNERPLPDDIRKRVDAGDEDAANGSPDAAAP